MNLTVNEKIIEKYDNPNHFVYAEYPHKSFWTEPNDDKVYREELIKHFSRKNGETVVYIHIPFCRKLCYYCTCVKEITSNYTKVTDYLDSLEVEIRLFKDVMTKNNLDPNVKEIFMGGGSPTILENPDFDRLIDVLSEFIDIKNLNRFCIEVDPRTVTKERLEYYHSKGVSTISLGVQDFDEEVQKSINRVQPYEMVCDLMKVSRKLFKSINFDIIVGLPYQTKKTITKTIKQVIKLAPDRISMDYYNRGNQKFYPHTALINDKAVGFFERHLLFDIIAKKLENAGYLRTGAGYFAKATDEVGEAFKTKKANFTQFGIVANQYTSMIGFGRSGVGNFGGTTGWGYMYQNHYGKAEYEKSLSLGQFPVFRAYQSKGDDEMRGCIVKDVRTYFELDKRKLEKQYNLVFDLYFAKELDMLKEFVKDGLVKITKNKVMLTDRGKHFSEVIGSVFDAHLQAPRYKNMDIL